MDDALYEKLKKIRQTKEFALKATPLLRTEIINLEGKTVPFRPRYYQYQAAAHMLVTPRMVLGDDTGIGKTVSTLAFLSYYWEKSHDKVIIAVPKSALLQWEREVARFTLGVKTFVAGGSLTERTKVYEAWVQEPSESHPVLLVTYACLLRDWHHGFFQPTLPNGKPDPAKLCVQGLLDRMTSQAGSITVIFDECSIFKNNRTKIWAVTELLSKRANRTYGLTATLLKNRLIEGYNIYKAIRPGTFGTKTKFLEDYCMTEWQRVKGGKQKIPIITGYINLGGFRSVIDPYFLGRKKYEVASELPILIPPRMVNCQLSSEENERYADALKGFIALRDGSFKDYEENKALTSLTYCQQIVDSVFLIGDCDLDSPPNSKERALLGLLDEELDGEKVIIYTRFAKLVKRLSALLDKAGVKNVHITGDDSDKVRQRAQDKFQDPKDETQVIIITDAGSEAINLQQASAMIFIDAPWSWGNYIQLLGRMVRIGSPHKGVLTLHLVAERPGKTEKTRRTIDHYVLDLLRGKKDLIDKVLGEGAVGALSFKSEGNAVFDLVSQMADPESV